MKTTNTVSKNIALMLAIAAAVLVAVLICLAGGGNAVFASDVTTEGAAAAQAAPSLTAVGAAVAIGLAALGGAIAMGMAIAKAMEGIARQPEADGKIRSVLMLGLVFIETVVIYALIVAILIMFVV